MDIKNKHEHFMRKALDLAKQAEDEGEVPVGAVVVYKDQIIAKGYNQTERLVDSTAHAEMIAITAAEEYMNSKYLKDCTLYVTLEPCLMCGGAIQWSQVGQVVFGAKDEEKGCVSTGMNMFPKKTKIIPNVLAEECGELVLNFFQSKRS